MVHRHATHRHATHRHRSEHSAGAQEGRSTNAQEAKLGAVKHITTRTTKEQRAEETARPGHGRRVPIAWPAIRKRPGWGEASSDTAAEYPVHAQRVSAKSAKPRPKHLRITAVEKGNGRGAERVACACLAHPCLASSSSHGRALHGPQARN